MKASYSDKSYKDLQINNDEFWEHHRRALKNRKSEIEIFKIFNFKFKDLINGMLEELPDKRFNMD